nr:hypothetical protein [Tanacetum cinerariifolium]
MNSRSWNPLFYGSVMGKGVGFELGRSGEVCGESWVSRRSGRKSGEVELQTTRLYWNEAATPSFVPAFKWFPAQSVRSSNACALDLPYFLVLNSRTSQSRQHGKSESDSYCLSD